MSLLLLALADFASACTRVHLDCGESRRFTEMPRNTQWVAAECTEGGLTRARGDEFRRVPASARREHRYLVRLRTWFPLAGGATYRVGDTTFTVAARPDRAAPAGGELRGFVRTREELLFVFAPVVDASPVFLEVESWSDVAPGERYLAVAPWTHIIADLPPGVPRDRQFVPFGPGAGAILEPRLPVVVASHARSYSDCGEGPRLVTEGTTTFRTRWRDAAGHTTPWGSPTRTPTDFHLGWAAPERTESD